MRLSIIKTLSYSDIFDFPLTRDEIFKFYIGKITDKKKVFSTLTKMVRTKQIGKYGKYYFLNGKKNLCLLRKKREMESKRKMRIARRSAFLLSFVPTIKLLGISGSLSMNNAQRRDDIDLFIITSKNTLWLTRFLVNLILLAKGAKRARNDSYGADSICPNMFVSISSLNVPNNLFSAHEVTQLKVLVNKNRTYEKFVSENSWVSRFLPHADKYRRVKINKKGNLAMLLIDRLFYIPQYVYMKRRITKENITAHQAMFHPKDKTSFVLALYTTKYKSYWKSLKSLQILQDIDIYSSIRYI